MAAGCINLSAESLTSDTFDLHVAFHYWAIYDTYAARLQKEESVKITIQLGAAVQHNYLTNASNLQHG